jgi:hypothetical protein
MKMNINKLTIKYSVRGISFYTPDDPFSIYRRLLQLYIDVKNDGVRSNYLNKLPEPLKLQKPLRIIDVVRRQEYLDVSKQPFYFLLFIYQNIPTEFWKFNINIDGMVSTIREAMKNYNVGDSFWIDMPGYKNKVKPTNLTVNVYDEIKRGTLEFPNYDTICEQVYNWGKQTKYAFGSISKLYPKGGEIV